MQDIGILILFALAGLAIGYLGSLFFRKMPAAWLLDYDETEITGELLTKKNLKLWPDALLIMLADAVILACGWIFADSILQFLAIALAAQPLLLIIVADIKTRIIPDQFVLALLPSAALLYLADSILGSEGWLSGLLFRLLGGLAGGAVLFIAGWIGEKIVKREAMGMGDVKLLAACGLMCGLKLLPLLLVLSFITAAFVALPLLIRKMRDPDGASDMAFGPFIALATLLVLLFSQPVFALWDMYLGLIY